MEYINEKLVEFNKYLSCGRKVAVIGLGVSNIPLIDYLHDLRSDVTIFDSREIDDIDKPIVDKIVDYGMSFSFGTRYLEKLVGFDIIFRSPSCLPTVPELAKELDFENAIEYLKSVPEEKNFAIKLAKAHKKALEDSAKAYKTAGKEAQGLAKKEDDLADKIGEVNAAAADMTKTVNFKAVVKQTADMVSSAGQAATAIMSIKNAVESLNNSDLSDGEKILQFVSGIAMSAPMAIGAIKGMTSALGIQNIAIGKNATLLKLAEAAARAKDENDKKSTLIQFMLAKIKFSAIIGT